MKKLLEKEVCDEITWRSTNKMVGCSCFHCRNLIFPLVVTQSFYLTQATFAGIYAIIAIGLGLLMGYAGQISLGQAAFYGVGAYTTSILTATWGWSPWLSLPFALLSSGFFSLSYGIYDVSFKWILLSDGNIGTWYYRPRLTCRR